MLQLVRIVGALPDGFAGLRAEADAEGHRHMARLADEWAEDPTIFVALIAALNEGEFVGIGGLTPEPRAVDQQALRMRRLYVSESARLQGVARAIASALMQEALDQVGLLTVHAGDKGAAAFWEALGFKAVQGEAWSHALQRH
jgi:GNAT superfamily N-acetyltransferase